jgi:hypothetical protein
MGEFTYHKDAPRWACFIKLRLICLIQGRPWDCQIGRNVRRPGFEAMTHAGSSVEGVVLTLLQSELDQ